jgi:hypothetical protein
MSNSARRASAINQQPGGLLRPLRTPEEVWDSVSMDLITQLPATQVGGYDAIVVFVDRLSKMAHFAPTHTTVSAEQLAQIYVATVFRQHGLSKNFVSV